MTLPRRCVARWAAFTTFLCLVPAAWPLDPHKALTQYSRRTWGQQDGLPQDTVRAIAQTTDGYLWLGTDEGLARFDGFEFTVFSRSPDGLPSNSITALAASPDGSLWIGTANGLAQYRDKKFRIFSQKDGLPDDNVTSLYSDHAGVLWVVAGVNLARLEKGKFTNYAAGTDLGVKAVRVVREDRAHNLVVAGYNRVVRLENGRPTELVDEIHMGGDVVLSMLWDHNDTLWVAGSLGLIRRTPDGTVRNFGIQDGLPDTLVRAVTEDHDGNIWAGTTSGIARLEGGRFVPPSTNIESDLVRVLLEDREGNLWVGGNNGLTRLRDDIFTSYGEPEGLPSNAPQAVLQDRAGRIWVGFQDAGLMLFSGGKQHVYTPAEGMPETEVYSIREAPNGDLLISSRVGLIRMHDSHFSIYPSPEPFGRPGVFDALEDSEGRIWMATPGGLVLKTGNTARVVAGGGPLIVNGLATLTLDKEGVLWAGSYGKGLWRVQGDNVKLIGPANGLPNENVRRLYFDPDGTLWIGTFGGGLVAMRDGKFTSFTQKDGLLSDNIASIADDGESLWLSTTHGVCRISKAQLREFASGRRKQLSPSNYGVGDGLRSAQCSPGYPTAGGGDRNTDGRIWFTTSRGLAVFDPRVSRATPLAPSVQFSEITADDLPIQLTQAAQLSPDMERLRIRYTAIHLSAPEQVQYSYRLSGVEGHWVDAAGRREISYNTLKHGHYQFSVRAQLADGQWSEASYGFEVLPHYYETLWFRLLLAASLLAMGFAIYQLRLRQIRYRFAGVLEERARLAREIHDTLAQGFVGISSQLDAVAMCMPEEQSPARKYLDMARRMARHSLTEARRSVMDLRASVLEGQDLAAALEAGMRMWTAGAGVDYKVEVSGPETVLPQEMEQHLLRIAQEAVTNTVKHAAAKSIAIKLHTEARKINLRIQDNGCGFEPGDVFSSRGGHFGLIGMRERAERLGGKLQLVSNPGEGTEVEITVPLP